MTNPVSSGGDPLFALASLLVERDNLRATLDDENLRAARDEERRALAREVALLHEAADDVRVGALVSGAITVVGAGTSAYLRGRMPLEDTAGDTLKSELERKLERRLDAELERKLEVEMKCADGFTALAGPAGALFGDATRADAEANAKQAAAHGSDAHARAEDALRHRERMDREVERGLDAVGQALESDAQGNLAIIANV
jgi:hypothetical protein